MTICAKCKHCKERGDSRGPIWHNFSCGHPEVRIKKGVDWITGEVGYLSKTDLGDVYFQDSPYPMCKKINIAGNCALYEEQKGIIDKAKAALGKR